VNDLLCPETCVHSVLSAPQFARRWRKLHPNSGDPYPSKDDEAEWVAVRMKALCSVHTPQCISEAEFEVTESHLSVSPDMSHFHNIRVLIHGLQDFSFELEYEKVKWKWETNFLGYRRSSHLISAHLIAPLISLTHLAFTNPGSINEQSDEDLEKVRLFIIRRQEESNIDI